MVTDRTLSYRSLIAAVAMATVGVVALMALLVVAGPWANAEQVDTPEGAPVETFGQPLDAARTPAHEFVAAVTAAVADQWDTAGVVPSALPPHPLVSGQPDLTPVVSTSMTVDRYAQVYVVVYPAGQGAAELDRQLATARSGGAWYADVDGPGVQSHDVYATWDGKRSTTRVWRHGDVLAYTVVDRQHASRLGALTAELDAIFTGGLDGQCVAPQSTLEDANRSPFHAPDGYAGYLLPETVSIPEPDLPEAPDDPVVEVGEETVTLDYATFPFTPEQVDEVQRPAVPSYPVWPELPAELEVPDAPEPPAVPPTETSVDVAHEDVDGPGCGWAFTGERVPPFDAEKAEKDRDEAVDRAETELEEGVERWQQAVAEYWEAWPTYLAQVAEYRTYAQEVAEVTEAWDVIAEQWRAFRQEHAQWQDEADAHAELVAEREALQAEWDEHVATCEAAAEEAQEVEAATPEPDPTAGETPAPDEEPEDEEADVDCEALERPAELDEPLPPAPVEPDEPADPRP